MADADGSPTRPTATASSSAPRRDAVRRGRRRLGQDHRARRPRRRAGHRAAASSSPRSPPSRSPRRRAPSCATASAGRCRSRPAAGDADVARPLPDGARPARRRRHRHAALLRPADPLRAPDRGRAAAAGRGARRGQLRRRVRAAVERLPRRAARRPDARAHAAAPARHRRAPATRSTRWRSAFEANWDLVEERVAGTGAGAARRRADALAPALRTRSTTCARRASDCRDGGDRLCARARRDRRVRRAAAGASTTSSTCSRRSTPTRSRSRRASASATAAGRGTGPTSTRSASSVPDAGRAARRGARPAIGEACAQRLGLPPSAASRCSAAGERRAAGRLEFHDLLVLARALLRDPEHGPARAGPAAPAATSASCSTSSRTPTRSRSSSPCASPPPTRAAAAAGAAPWDAGRRSRPGTCSWSATRSSRSTGSGGPTSRTFLAARDRLRRRTAAASSQLTSNFRSAAPVIDWVNDVFGRLMAEPPDARRCRSRRSPTTSRSTPSRPAPPVGPAGRRRSAAADHPTKTPRRRAARAPRRPRSPPRSPRAVDEGWSVDDGGDGWRPARLGDITILVPARTSLPFLAGRARRRPASRTGPSPARSSTPPGPCATCSWSLRAVDDPTDDLRIARRPAHAAARLRRRRPVPLQGRARRPLELPGRAARHRPRRRSRSRAGLALPARRCTTQRHWLAPSELLDRIARDRRVLRARLRRGPAPRRVAAAAVRDRPGPGVERRDRRQPARLPALGRRSRPRRAPGSPRRSCPRPTTTPCGS